jgi:hypothetical protein
VLSKDLNARKILVLFVFLLLPICLPSNPISKVFTLNYSNSLAFAAVDANELLQALTKPGSVISLLEGGGVPVGLNTNTTLQLDLLNETQKFDLLSKVKQYDSNFRCIGENQSAVALQDASPDVRYSTITIKAIDVGKCIATDSSSDHTQDKESNGFQLILNYTKEFSQAKIEHFPTNAK